MAILFPSIRPAAVARLARAVLGAVALASAAGTAVGPAAADTARCRSDDETGGRVCTLPLNKSLVLDLPRDAHDILVSNPDIADAVIRTSRRIYLTGVAVGETNIFVFDGNGGAIVSMELRVERDIAELESTLARLIPDSDIKVEVISDNVVLSGSVKNANDSRRAEDLAGIFANGGANSGAGQQSAQGAAVQSRIVNMLSIEGQDQVFLKVTVSEMQRSIAKQLGIDMRGGLDLGGMVTSVVTDNPFAVAAKALTETNITSTIGNPDASGLSVTLRALEREGMVRTLAEPTLTAISGESAAFLAGGEFPVPVGRDRDGAITIEYKPFGVSLAFTPVVLSEGRISVRVKTEVSELSTDNAVALGGISLPSIKVRRAETTLEMPSGGSLVLGGLLQDSVRQSITGFPGLKRLPVLGTLFRSRDFARSETELVIIVTPYLVAPQPRTALAQPDDGFDEPNDAFGNFLGRLNRVYGPADTEVDADGYRGRFGFIFD